jgi:hypothetical protein
MAVTQILISAPCLEPSNPTTSSIMLVYNNVFYPIHTYSAAVRRGGACFEEEKESVKSIQDDGREPDRRIGTFSTVQCSTVQYSTVQYSTVQYNAVQYTTVQYSTVQYSTMQHSTAQHSTLGFQVLFLLVLPHFIVFIHLLIFISRSHPALIPSPLRASKGPHSIRDLDLENVESMSPGSESTPGSTPRCKLEILCRCLQCSLYTVYYISCTCVYMCQCLCVCMRLVCILLTTTSTSISISMSI